MISTRLAGQTDILASLKSGEKFSFVNDSDVYFFIENSTFHLIVWNDTKKEVVKFNNSTYENLEKKIIRISNIEEKTKTFFDNFIENCETSERLDSVQTAYFCNWAKTLCGKEITPLPAEKNIVRIKIIETMKMHSSCLCDKTLKNVPEEIPMQLLNEEQAQNNHRQTLQRLNERGGLGVLEMLDNIHKRRLTSRTETQADVDELNNIIKTHNDSSNL